MRVLSYNIRHGLGLDDRIDLQRIADIVVRSGASLAALQEVDRETTRSGGVDQYARLAELTGMAGVYLETIPFQGGRYGIAVLSRRPVERTYRTALPGREPRGALAVETVDENGAPFLFGCTHFDLDPAARLATVKALEEWCRGLPGLPFILCGDFNSVPGDAILGGMEANWTLVYDAARRATYPADRPTDRIDHLAFRPRGAWMFSAVEVLPEAAASDHRPLCGEADRVGAPQAYDTGKRA